MPLRLTVQISYTDGCNMKNKLILEAMKKLTDMIYENMIKDIYAYDNISKCIKKIENEGTEYALVCELTDPYKTKYRYIMFQKDMDTNKVNSISLIQKNDNAKSNKIDFNIIPTHDKEEINKNIIFIQ